jgi:hypothetical protein
MLRVLRDWVVMSLAPASKSRRTRRVAQCTGRLRWTPRRGDAAKYGQRGAIGPPVKNRRATELDVGALKISHCHFRLGYQATLRQIRSRDAARHGSP